MSTGLSPASRLAIAAIAATACGALAAPAEAGTIIRSSTFGGAGPVVAAIAGVAEFDPAEGTLDRVDVAITGTLIYRATLLPSLFFAPVVRFDALGAGGRGFDFAGDGATFILPVVANPSPTSPLSVAVVASFTLSFGVDVLSDLSGVVIASPTTSAGALIPPANVETRRADYVEGIAPIGISETLLFTNASPFAGSIEVFGGMTVTYTFTAPPPVPAPLGLLAVAPAAAIALVARRRRA